jgi:hypothetical protein
MNVRNSVSRRSELMAVREVQIWVGGDGVVIDRGVGPHEDFWIDYADGRSEIGEVKSALDPLRQKQWSRLLDFDRHQILPLPGHLGLWGVGITPSAQISRLSNELPGLLTTLDQKGIQQLHIFGDWPQSPEANLCRALGITHLRLSNGKGDSGAFLLPEGRGGAVPEDSDSAAEWAEAYIAQERWRKSWDRLVNSAADERHIFLWLGDEAPTEALLASQFHPDRCPRIPVSLPIGISHLWIGLPTSFSDKRYAWLLQPLNGWQAVDVTSIHEPEIQS